ncbi:TIGR04222 domain-containing membrane protein [Kitasatospora sp. NPDC052896]|uniref:TIGR04222 domain-containing membrane protein n=1 Tax=Kitasatospora sp. NPDC052896 TaxID=3364061 RepID=UPI0037C7D322
MWLVFLVPACVVAVLSCLRLVRAAAAADALSGLEVEPPAEAVGIGLYETAYLAGGPERVVDLALVLMSGRGRLHLAHTGWTTVVDPQGRSRLERALIATIGPEGQRRTAELRAELAGHPTVVDIGARLAMAGLATPAPVRESTVLAVRQVRQALLLSVVMVVAAMSLAGPDQADLASALAWFSLPLILTTGTLLMARVDVRPYTRWASPAGQEVLGSVRLPRPGDGPDESARAEKRLLTAVAMGGPDAVPDPRLRAALRPLRRGPADL